MQQILKKSERVILFLLITVLLNGRVCCVKANAVSISSNKSSTTANTKNSELKGAWISYLEFLSAGVSNMSKKEFYNYIDKMFTQCKSMGMNTVIVQIRPSSDAMYPSKYFPWSSYVSGVQGRSLNYDPTAYMVSAAHKRGLQFYAWINPYRVSATSTDIKKLSVNNPARKWRLSKKSADRRNVLTFNKQLYYNPSKQEVRTLIVNGVKEVVKKYNVNGVIFDDYFYPNLGSKYKSNFDYSEFKQYKLQCKQNHVQSKSIENWRRGNVSALLRRVKTAVKAIDKKVVFGVSPQGSISNLKLANANYCDVAKWMNSDSYLDFICPQIYWSTTNPVAPYKEVLNQWIDLRKSKKVKLYVALSVYKAGLTNKEAQALSPADLRWYKVDTNLKEQVLYARQRKQVTGFMFYRYDNMISSKARSEMKNLQSIL